MNIGLAQRLRDGTAALHTTTERAGIMPALLRGRLPLAGFVQLQRSLLAIYQALEAGLQAQAAHPWLAPLALGPLARSAALQVDVSQLDALQRATGAMDLAPAIGTVGQRGGDDHRPPPLPPSALHYADHLEALARQQPGLLAAHAYVRYLGDLAGGQALRRVAQQAYGLVAGAGTRFYDFGTPEAVRATSQRLRAALDALPVDDVGADALVAEAQWAFAQHALLFDELAAAARDTPTGHPAAQPAA